MPNLPTPIRAALGLAATAVDEARKLPETVPHVVSSVPILAVSTAMQASLRLQQHLAVLTARGDEVLSQLRGSTPEPPSWATFDESPDNGADDPQGGKAAFDRIDYDNTGFAEGSDDDEEGKGRWDAVGVGGTQAEADRAPAAPTPDLADALAALDRPAAEPAPAKAAPGKAKAARATTAKATATKAPVAKVTPAKATKSAPAKAAKAAPGKATPTKAAKRGGRQEPDHEPLEVAASKAKPSATPNPATMAAEILQAHEAAADE